MRSEDIRLIKTVRAYEFYLGLSPATAPAKLPMKKLLRDSRPKWCGRDTVLSEPEQFWVESYEGDKWWLRRSDINWCLMDAYDDDYTGQTPMEDDFSWPSACPTN